MKKFCPNYASKRTFFFCVSYSGTKFVPVKLYLVHRRSLEKISSYFDTFPVFEKYLFEYFQIHFLDLLGAVFVAELVELFFDEIGEELFYEVGGLEVEDGLEKGVEELFVVVCGEARPEYTGQY